MQGLESLAIDMLARGLSVRDIEVALKDESCPAIVIEDGGSATWEVAVEGLASARKV